MTSRSPLRALSAALPVALLLASAGFAQTAQPAAAAPTSPTGQLRGGLNFSSTKYEPELGIDNEMGFGPNVSLLLDVGPATGAHFLVGAGFDSRPHTESFGDLELKIKTNYIALPVMVGLRSTSPTGSAVFVNAGVEPAFNISAEGEFEGESADLDVQSFDFGLRGEFGVIFKSASGTGFLLGAGYTHSLTSYAPDADEEDEESFDAYHRIFRIFAGITFGGP